MKTKRPNLIALRLSDAELELVKARAKSEGCSVSDVIRTALFRGTKKGVSQ